MCLRWSLPLPSIYGSSCMIEWELTMTKLKKNNLSTITFEVIIKLFSSHMREWPENTLAWAAVLLCAHRNIFYLFIYFFSVFTVSQKLTERQTERTSETYKKMWQDFHPPLSGFLNKSKTHLPLISVFDGGRENLRAKPWGKHAALSHPLVISAGRWAKTCVFQKWMHIVANNQRRCLTRMLAAC